MNEREKIIRLWFDMWLQKKDLGISEIFADNSLYIESWGPEYHGSAKIKLWFDEWNTRGTVLQWDIKQFFHKENKTIVEWYFKNQMKNGKVEAFDGVSLIEWTSDNNILFLKKSSVVTSITMILMNTEMSLNSETKKQVGFNAFVYKS